MTVVTGYGVLPVVQCNVYVTVSDDTVSMYAYRYSDSMTFSSQRYSVPVHYSSSVRVLQLSRTTGVLLYQVQ